jgi:hypothetical protein
MQSKVRSAAAWVVLVAAVAGCAAHHADAKLAAGTQFTTEQARQLACLDLRDHIVALYADAYAEDEGMTLSEDQRAAFRSGWAEQLAKRGTFERFEQSCFFSLTPRKYECGMASRSTDGLVACMKLSARDVPSSELSLRAAASE